MLLVRENTEYRYERKFCTDWSRQQIEQVVQRNQACFTPVFAPRWINNIYLDTADFKSYQENVVGAAHDRAKIRIRWYGDLDGLIENPVLEVKIKQGFVNRKAAYPLAPLSLDAKLGRTTIHDVLRRSDLPESLRSDLLKLELALANRYYRSYYLSADNQYRITIDTDLAYYRMHALRNRFLTRWCDNDSTIVELKYGLQLDRQADRISQQFPFRLSRSSKYANGIQRVVAY